MTSPFPSAFFQTMAMWLLLAFPLLCPSAATAEEEIRTWTDSTGQYKIEASYQKIENGKVHLLKPDGEVIVLPSSKLSSPDLRYVREQIAKDRVPPKRNPYEKPLPESSDGQWLAWRGPNRNGTAEGEQRPVATWSETEHILWKTPIPGRGHSSPTVVGNRIVLTTADEQEQSQAVVCFDRATGQQLWLTELNRGGFPPKIHNKNTHATPTVASDGAHLFASFHHHGQVVLTALTLEGQQVWQATAGDYQPRQYEYGYAPSPLLHQQLLITCADFEQGWLAAFDKTTGKEVWRTKRPPGISYSSPIVAHVADRDQLLLTGMEQLTSYDPATGEQLWSTKVLTAATCGTVVWDDQTIYASGGYPDPGTAAIAADGSGRVLWQNREKCYEQSMLLHEGYLYAVNDRGIGFCWSAAEGIERWTVRIGGEVSASPILADGKVFTVNEKGTATVFKADPDRFQPLAQNQLGNEAFATPAIVDSKIYLRMADNRNGPRQEYLVCIGE